MPRLTAPITLAFAIAAWPSAARADATDACISGAERSQVERKAGHLRAARDLLVSCSAEACPALIRRDCARWLGEVEAATPSVVLRATDAAGDDVPRARVAVDGATLAPIDGRAVPLDPGPHRFRFEGAGVVVERGVVVREGERDRPVSVRLAGPLRASMPPGVWVLGGGGGLAMLAGGALWIVGRSERGHLYDTCGAHHACSNDQIDAARSKLVAGDVAFGVGVAAAGAAIVWAIAAPRSAPRATVGAAPVARGGALSLRASFF